ncbi:MAG TPA: histidinol-phosphate transaminase [Pyrinomonadaceae bacterium]|nr:histidinol-phosphate transaminase [Pyrinomonadaceae bacterium]
MPDNQLANLFNVRSHNPSFFAVRNSVGCRDELLDFCIPVNLHFPPAELTTLIHKNLDEILRYYPDYIQAHQQHLAEMTGLSPDTIVPCNGSTEIITLLCRNASGPILTSVPTFSRWTDLPEELHVSLFTIQRKKENEFRLEVDEIVSRAREVGARTVVISNPNNPTGACLELNDVQLLVNALEDLDAVIIDESFIDFSELQSVAPLAARAKNLVVVKSMGKSLGWHGVRLGYAVAEPRRAEKMRNWMPYWNINGLAAFILKTVRGFKREYRASFAKVAADRIYMSEQISTLPGLKVYPSQANFLFVELLEDISGRSLRDRLLKNHGLMVRECSNKMGSSEQFLRLAVQRKSAVDRLVGALLCELPNISRANAVV